MSINNQTHFSNFVVEIPDVGITESFKLNVQTAMIPGIRIPISELPSGTQGIGRAMIPGSTFEFDPLMIRFLVDENLDSWLQMYRWMLSINNYITGESNGWEEGVLPKFVTLHIMDNTKENVILSIHYFGAWCSELGEIEYNYTEEGDPAITCTATLPYKYFQVEKDGKIIIDRQTMEQHAKTTGRSIGLHPSQSA